jgi:transposase
MVRSRPPTGNPRRPPFAAPPWDSASPAWQALDQRLPLDHLARRIAQAVARLDLTALLDSYGGTGSVPYRPDLMLRVVLYEMQRGHQTPAQWHRHARENEPVRWLAQGIQPSRARWYAFRDRLGPLLDDFNRQLLQQAQQAGLTTARRAALDGSLMAAQASRHRLLNGQALGRRLEQLAQACAADKAGLEPALVPSWMAKRPRGRQRQQQRYQQAEQSMARRQAANRRRPSDKRQQPDKVKVSPSEPEAALGLDKYKVYRPLYNVQYLDDLDSPFVLAYEVFAQPGDSGTLGPMLGRAELLLGHPIRQLLADAGYATGPHLRAAEQAGVTLYAPWQENDATPRKRAGKGPEQLPKGLFRWLPEQGRYECPEGKPLELVGRQRRQRSGGEYVVLSCYRCSGEHCQACPRSASCTSNPQAGRTVSRSEYEEEVERLRARMGTEAARALYRLRRQTVELAFADVKEHRRLRRFSGWGLRRARIQAGLNVLVHNALALLRATADRKTGPGLDANPETPSA